MGVSYTKNVAGDFYVEDGCCITCGVPTGIAPDIFEYDEDHCYVKKQPTTPDELERTLEVMNNQEVDCIHYKGTDREIVRRLVESGEGHNCDSRLTEFFQERLRNVARVSFPAESPGAFLEAMISRPKHEKRYDGTLSYSFTSARIKPDFATIGVSWYKDKFHTLEITQQPDDAFVLRLTASVRISGHGFSRLIHNWLLQLHDASDITWMTEDEFRTGSGQPAPF